MHVYLREDQVRLRMEEVDGQGLVPDGSDLVPTAFFAANNPHPSFRALLPPDTVGVLRDALGEPVTLGVLAEEPENDSIEIRAMVGLAVPIDASEALEAEEGESEPWRASIGDSDAWRGDETGEFEDTEVPRTALLAFAPLVRIKRRFPADFGEELADLLETALAGVTRPALEARVDQMLDDL
ncbi:MAG: hypothetical protein GEU90_17960 [Gemmatimonas sp.]|nr:hypothetical protein [Gemmatimonas sp.]